MSVLTLKNVNKRYRHGHRELVALRNVSVEIEGGEVVCVSGARSSGRSTLLRIIAGEELPDEGRVEFVGTSLTEAPPAIKRQVVLCNTRFLPSQGRDACDHVMMPLLAVRVAADDACLRAHRALERVGADHLATVRPSAWIPSERFRVSLARAIVREPRLILIDEPTNGVDALERDPLLSLIQTVSHERGIAVVLTAGDTTSVTGADRVLRLMDGELVGQAAPTNAEVIELRRRPSSESS